MDDNTSNLLSPSTDDHEIPTKRQKLDTTSSSTLNASGNVSVCVSECEWSNLTEELTALRTTLLEMETITAEFNKIEIKIEESLEEEENNQELQVKMDKYTMNSLEKGSPQETHDPQVTAVLDTFEMKSNLKGKIMDSLVDNTSIIRSSSDRTPKPPEGRNNDIEIQKRVELAEKRIQIEWEQMSMKDWTSDEFDMHMNGLGGVGIKIQESNSEISRWDGKQSFLSRMTDANDRIEQMVKVLHSKYEELSLRLQEYESREIESSSAATNDEMFRFQELESMLEQGREESKCSVDDLKESNKSSGWCREFKKEFFQ